MIYDSIKNLGMYSGVIPHTKEISEFIEKNDLLNMECRGGIEVCDGVTMNLAEYEPGKGGDFEAHRCYYDLQYAVKGCELIEVIPTSKAVDSKGYNPDAEFFPEGKCNSSFAAIDEGDFAFLAPQDAHKPCIKSTTQTIRKAVFKIKID